MGKERNFCGFYEMDKKNREKQGIKTCISVWQGVPGQWTPFKDVLIYNIMNLQQMKENFITSMLKTGSKQVFNKFEFCHTWELCTLVLTLKHSSSAGIAKVIFFEI